MFIIQSFSQEPQAILVNFNGLGRPFNGKGVKGKGGGVLSF